MSYLSNLHKQPPHHKKRFAFLASSTITLVIFGVWSLATFGVSGLNMKGKNSAPAPVAKETEVSPLGSLRIAVASSIEALMNTFGELKAGVKSIDMEAEYKQMRDKALDTYGQ